MTINLKIVIFIHCF